MINKIKKEFDNAVKNHVMTIELDQDIHRSILFKIPNDSELYFRINTWAGHLSISGDVGTYVFSRLDDMFEFFRDKPVNLNYWSEKLEAPNHRSDDVKEWNENDFLKALRSDLEGNHTENDINEILDDFIDVSSHEHEAWKAACDHEAISDEFGMDSSFKRFTARYIWICCAIVWAISEYDKAALSKTLEILEGE